MVTAISVAAVLGRAEHQAVFELPPLNTLVFHRMAYSSSSSTRGIVDFRIKFPDVDSNNAVTLSLTQGNKDHGIREAQKGRQQHR